MKGFKLLVTGYFILSVIWFYIGSVEGIVGGKDASLYQFKYMVSVHADDQHVCGGAILDSINVLTAAHCVIGEDNKFLKKKFTVLARVVYLMLDNVAPIEVAVSAILVPIEYVRVKRQHGQRFYNELGDIAILKLKEQLPLNENLIALDLPKRDDNNHYSKYVGSKAILTGFGIDTSPNGDIKRNCCTHLKYANVIVQHKNACKSFVTFDIDQKHLFGIVEGSVADAPKGACIGDDGSPLVFEGKIIGVLAQYQADCNDGMIGSMYTRTSGYIRYIKNAMAGRYGKESRYAMYKETKTNSGQIISELIDISN